MNDEKHYSYAVSMMRQEADGGFESTGLTGVTLAVSHEEAYGIAFRRAVKQNPEHCVLGIWVQPFRPSRVSREITT